MRRGKKVHFSFLLLKNKQMLVDVTTELACEKGEVIEVLSNCNDGWLKVEFC